MASAGERCHISVWLSESCCVLNLARQGFNSIALLGREEKVPHTKNPCMGEALVAGTAWGQQGRSMPVPGTWPR